MDAPQTIDGHKPDWFARRDADHGRVEVGEMIGCQNDWAGRQGSLMFHLQPPPHPRQKSGGR
jgi:hypothetical protein